MLKKITTLITCLFLSSFAFADNGIVVVSADKIRVETKAGQSIIKQIQDLQMKFRDKVTKLQKDFDGQKVELDKQKTILSKEAFAKKEAEFNNKYNESRKQIQQEASGIEQQEQKAWNEFNIIVMEVINNMAKELKYSQVFPAEVLVYSDSKADVTAQVIEAVNKKSEHITLKAEEAKK